ncbi:MAG: hypothetical protein ACTHU0_16250 [Kofleriaceae bacterium]
MDNGRKHYGIVDGITEGEPGSAAGNLSVSAMLARGVNDVSSAVVVGSTSGSPINLAQVVLTAQQAIRLGSLIAWAGQDALASDRRVEQLRKYGPAAVRLCFALASADLHDVLVDQSRIRLGVPLEAQQLAELSYQETSHSRTDGDWRALWRAAGEKIQKEVGHG